MLNIKGFIAILSAAIFMACVVPAHAGTILTTSPVTASPGSTGNSFEVDVVNTGTTAEQIGGFVFEVTTTNPGLTFTDVTTATTDYSYIFDGNSLFGPDLSLSGPGQTFDAADIAATPLSYTILNAGQSLGLGEVFFDLAPGAAPPKVSFNLLNSSLADGAGNAITITPEPPSLLLMGTGALALLGFGATRRRVVNP